MSKGEDAHTILITSTVGNEGKTTVALNLGSIMSIANKKTIIVSLDMRKPTLHKKFNLPNIFGVSSILVRESDLEHCIQKTEYKYLDILTSGAIPPNPSELIGSENMKEMLDELKSMYNVIILDTPPIGLVTDATTLLHLADTTIYVLRANYSKKEYLNRLKNLYFGDKLSGLGVLLNDMNIEKGNYDYGYYEN